MKLFSLKRILRKPPTPVSGVQLPYDLSREKLQRLNALTSSPDWSLYLSLLDSICTFSAEDLLQRRSTEDIHFLRGYILGLRKAGTTIPELVSDLEREDARIRERSESDAERSELLGKLATFGSRFYRSPSVPVGE